jgi:hypothetical protein
MLYINNACAITCRENTTQGSLLLAHVDVTIDIEVPVVYKQPSVVKLQHSQAPSVRCVIGVTDMHNGSRNSFLLTSFV